MTRPAQPTRPRARRSEAQSSSRRSGTPVVVAERRAGHHAQVAVGRELAEPEKRLWLDWLAGRSHEDGIAGFDVAGWPAATWVLHAMYEDQSSSSDATWDDVRRERLAAGLDAPHTVGSFDLDEHTTVIGGSLGMSAAGAPGGRSRVRWREMAARLSIDLEANDRPPSFRWFPYRSWPERIDPPDEGSLDRESLHAIVELLATVHADPSSRCIAYYAPLANGARFDETWMREVDVVDVLSLVDPAAGRVGTPSNWWSREKAWMVFTDWDLWATKVSGPSALIAAIERDPRLECIRWERGAADAIDG